MFGLDPITEATVFTLFLAFVISLIYRVMIDQDEAKKIKEQIKSYNEKMKKAQKAGNMKEVNKFTNEILRLNKENMSRTFKPMMLTFLIFMAAWYLFFNSLGDLTIISPFSLPIIGTKISLGIWYMFLMMPSTIVFRKILGVN